MITRRTALAAGLLGAASTPVASLAAGGAMPIAPPDLSFLREAPLMNADRARQFMEREGLDALLVTQPPNVFYVSNHWPQLDRMGYAHSMFAIFCRDPARPIALVAHAFGYYYTHSDEAAFANRIAFMYTQPAEKSSGETTEEPAAVPPAMFRIVDEALVTPRERRRRDAIAHTHGNYATGAIALKHALRELKLEKATLGVDEPAIESTLRTQGMAARVLPAADTLRRIRLAKSPTELQLMRLAARQNREAALIAAHSARAAGSTRQLRARFFAEAALRGNTGFFMVIDGSSSEVVDAPLRDGMALMIDCVSTCRFYHGDFARTIFVGEPRPQMKRATAAIATAWDDIRSQLRAGLKYSDVRRLGQESLRKQGVDLTVSFTPHSVGLFHTDHPRYDLVEGRAAQDIVLEENMILSVDCPVLDAGLGGSAHLEDLMWIRANGAEPLHDIDERVIVV
jgi:Xaa-Pro aminopeptidase